MSGDKVQIKTESFYQLPGGDPGQPLTLAASELISAFVNSSAVGAAKGILSAADVLSVGTNISSIEAFLRGNGAPHTRAKAYVNRVLFDDQLKFVTGAVDPVQEDGGYKLHHPLLIIR